MEFAIIPDDPTLRQADPAWDHVVSALNVQVTQHAGPAWSKSATVSGYSSPAAAPANAIPVVVMKSPPPGVEGCHRWQDDKASAVVRWRANGAWSVAASHEILETLVDPSLAETRPGPDPAGSSAIVDCLLEVSDPCAGQTYKIGADIEVSDFCLPAYYAKNSSGPFTYCKQPLHLWEIGKQVSPFGYITWSANGSWLQLMDGSIRGPVSKEVLLANSLKLGMRGAVDRWKQFAKPPHLRSKGRTARKGSAKRLRSKNQALNTWLHTLRSNP
jgi:hypothetical protein